MNYVVEKLIITVENRLQDKQYFLALIEHVLMGNIQTMII